MHLQTLVGRLALSAVIGLTLTVNSHAIIQSQSRNAATQGAGATTDWEGVCQILRSDGGFGSGTLIKSAPGTAWILTAAHVVFDGNTRLTGSQLQINFAEPGIAGTFYSIDYVMVNPGFNPALSVFGGSDLAMLRVRVDVNSVTQAWGINSGQIADERASTGGGLVAHKVGYGLGGDGVNGATGDPGPPNASPGIKREGTNFVELIGPVAAGANINDTTPHTNFPPHGLIGGLNLLEAPDDTLIYDFDDHLAAGNGPLDVAVNPSLEEAPFDTNFTGPAPNRGITECDTTPGDSGGPMFMFDSAAGEFIIVGVTSYGTDSPTTDPNDDNVIVDFGSRFGDIAVDVRVQDHATWIGSLAFAPEPGSLALTFFGGLGFLGFARRRCR